MVAECCCLMGVVLCHEQELKQQILTNTSPLPSTTLAATTSVIAELLKRTRDDKGVGKLCDNMYTLGYRYI